MKLKGKEKFFWERNFNVTSIAAIPQEINKITGIDSEEDDEYFFYLTSRVSTVHEIYLKCTNVTDEGVQHISNLKGLKSLTLKNHYHITKNCLPYLNKLTDLYFLDISKNSLLLEDLSALSNLHNLKELYVSSGESDESISQKIRVLQDIIPNCTIYVNYQKYE